MKEGEITVNAQQFPPKFGTPFLDALIELGDANLIHPTAIIGENVKLGKNNIIGAFCIIDGNTVIGDNNLIISHSSIGTAPEHKAYWKEKYGGVQIGNNCTIREFTTINAGTFRDTVLKDNVVMLRGSHVGHDSLIGDGATLSCNVLIGGESFVGAGANMGLGSVCHQRSRIGAFAMVGMNAVVTKKLDIVAFNKYAGVPVKHLGLNTHVTDKLTQKEIDFIIETHNIRFDEYQKENPC